MKKFIFFVVIVIFAISASPSVEFLNWRFESFLKNMVPQDEQQGFKEDYEKLLNTMQSYKKEKKEGCIKQLCDKGRCALEVKFPGYAQVVDQVESKQVVQADEKKVRTFLTRFGAYQEFEEACAKKHASIWHRIKETTRHGYHKVAGWFKRDKKDVDILA